MKSNVYAPLYASAIVLRSIQSLLSHNSEPVQVGRIEQVETAKEAKEKRGPKATIRRELTRIHTPATNTGTSSASRLDLVTFMSAQNPSILED